ncbi:TlpA family protein disulfide reductase [Flavihumibacter solisilvae]|nr:redoxin domain-containing protein [Flavihumibacter solisilvae]
MAIVIAILNSVDLKGQANSAPRALAIGETCPDFLFTNLLHYEQDSFRLSSLRGKWVILDFWSRGCRGCILILKNKIPRLQQLFNSQLVIIPITREKQGIIADYFNKTNAFKEMKPFTMTGDTTIFRYFPHTGVPHEVWINPEGKLAAITDGGKVNETNVRTVLERGYTTFPEWKPVMKFESHQLLMSAGANDSWIWNLDNIEYTSILTRFAPQLPFQTGGPARVFGNRIKMLVTNATIENLYQMAFGIRWKPQILEHNPDFWFLFPARTRFEVKDSSFYLWPGRKSEDYSSFPDSLKYFCYELMLPLKDSLHLRSYMQQDLNRIFGNSHCIEGQKEKRKVTCWALTRTGKKAIVPSKGGKSEVGVDLDKGYVQLQNATITKFLFYWISYCQWLNPVPIIDESGITIPLDFTLQADLENIESVNHALLNYGLEFRLVERELEMVVIRDKK